MEEPKEEGAEAIVRERLNKEVTEQVVTIRKLALRLVELAKPRFVSGTL